MQLALLGVVASTVSATSQAETITLTLTTESYLSATGVCGDPLGPLGSIIRSATPEQQQAILATMGLDELPPPCEGPVSVVLLSGTIDLELTSEGVQTAATVAVLGSDVVAEDVLNLELDLGLLGNILTDLESVQLNVASQEPPVEVQGDGTFALANSEFTLNGGTAQVSGEGAIGGLIPVTDVDLATTPVILPQGRFVDSGLEGSGVDSVDLQGILDGSYGSLGVNEVRLVLPIALIFTPKFFDDNLAPGGFYSNINGLIVATGTSPFPVPPSSLLVVPEPSTLLLAVVAVPLLGVAGYRSRKRLRCKQV